MRLLKIIADVILVLSGIFCFANPGTTFLSVAFVLGLSMLLSGISGILAYGWLVKRETPSKVVLIEGIMTLILGFLTLSNQLLSDSSVIVFFSLWVIFSGVLRLTDAVSEWKLKDYSKRYWLLGVGFFGIILGIYGFNNNIMFDFSTVMMTGFIFVMQGINVLIIGIHLPFHSKHKRMKSTI